MTTREDFRQARHERTANRWLQGLLALVLVVILNTIATLPNFRIRADLTADQRHSLTPASQSLLADLNQRAPKDTTNWVTLAVLEPPADTVDAAVTRRLERLVEALEQSPSAWLKVVRPTTGSAALLGTLTARHGPLPANAGLVLACGNQLRALSFGELAQLGEAGRLEEVLLASLLEVTDERALIAYLVRGHGELSSEDSSPARGLSQFARQMRLANFELRPLRLAGAVPRDASLIIIAGPLSAFSPAEAELVRSYLHDRNGRGLLLLDAGRDHGLESLLESWALFSPDAEVREPDASRRLPDGDIAVRNLDAKLHPIAQVLADLDLPLVAGRLRPVSYDLGSTPDSTLAVWQMAYSSAESWGESDPRRDPARFDPARDLPGPICIAVAAERQAGIGTGTQGTAGGRLVVVGSSEIAANARLARGGNREFLLKAVHWLGGRERAVVIPPRALDRFSITASSSQMGTLAWQLALPALLIAALGLAVSTWRRRN